MRPIAFVLSTALLLGCAGSAPERTLYLLRASPPNATGRVEAPLAVGLGRIAVAAYLDQDGIVVETDGAEVRAAGEHRWAEPLEAGLRSLLRAEISRAVGYDVSGDLSGRTSWDRVVDVDVFRFHGTMAGTAFLDAAYHIRPAAAGDATTYRFYRSAPLPRAGYAGLVEAEQQLARELATAIAGSLGEPLEP